MDYDQYPTLTPRESPISFTTSAVFSTTAHSEPFWSSVSMKALVKASNSPYEAGNARENSALELMKVSAKERSLQFPEWKCLILSSPLLVFRGQQRAYIRSEDVFLSSSAWGIVSSNRLLLIHFVFWVEDGDGMHTDLLVWRTQ